MGYGLIPASAFGVGSLGSIFCPKTQVVLAKEAGISYASVAMVTDYDCWREDVEPVSVQKVSTI